MYPVRCSILRSRKTQNLNGFNDGYIREALCFRALKLISFEMLMAGAAWRESNYVVFRKGRFI